MIEFIKEFCVYADITNKEFWSTAEKFRGKMWNKHGNEWENEVWTELKRQL